MKFHPSNLIQISLGCLALLSITSCNKDSDLLAEYVVENPKALLVNDLVVTLANNPITIEPLKNDSFEEPDKVTIVEVTPPSMGTAVINEDNTVTYTPDTDKTGTDQFDYATNVTNPDNTVTQETGSVTVTVTDKKPSPTEPTDMGELKAFPGAEGFGKNATGGRGGKVVEVTTTDFSGPGSLKEALEMKGPRTIIFRVGGTIQGRGSEYLQIPSGSGDVTIAGETAPGGGILIRGARFWVKDSNVIIRHIRFRQDPSNSTGSNDDALTIDGTNGGPLTDIIIDHCSFSWGIDGNLDIRNTWGATVQNSIITGNAKSNLINANSKNISYVKNIFALVDQRVVRANTIEHLDLTYEMINNYVYGVNWPGGPSEGLKATIENNVYEASNDFSIAGKNLVELLDVNPENYEPNSIENTYLYVNGNDLGDAFTSEIKSTVASKYIFKEPLYRSTYTPLPTTEVKSYVVDHAGAYKNLSQGLDAVDLQVINNIKSKSGRISYSGTFPSISNGTPYPDTDKDGMDDQWEKANGLNVGSPDNNDDNDGNGYTNLEEFLYFLYSN